MNIVRDDVMATVKATLNGTKTVNKTNNLVNELNPEIIVHNRVINNWKNDNYLQLIDQTLANVPHLVRVPYFNHLTIAEKKECARIFEEVEIEKLRSINYHYFNDRAQENGYSYVVENLKYILTLPDEGAKTDYVKYVMIISLAKMKFLSKRNIDFIFSNRSEMYDSHNGFDIRPSSLKNIIDLYGYSNVSLSMTDKLLYDNSGESVFYVVSTIHRWYELKNVSLRDVVMKQEVFGPEIDEMKSSSIYFPRAMRNIAYAVSCCDDDKNPWKILKKDYGKKNYDSHIVPGRYADNSLTSVHLDGLMDYSADDFLVYDTFVAWGMDGSISLKDFFETYQFDTASYSKQDFDDFLFNLASKIYNKDDYSSNYSFAFMNNRERFNMSSNSYSAYYVFCFLNHDEEKFEELLRLTNFINVNNSLNAERSNSRFIAQSSNNHVFLYNEAFLEFLKVILEDESNIPISYLMNLHEFNKDE